MKNAKSITQRVEYTLSTFPIFVEFRIGDFNIGANVKKGADHELDTHLIRYLTAEHMDDTHPVEKPFRSYRYW